MDMGLQTLIADAQPPCGRGLYYQYTDINDHVAGVVENEKVMSKMFRHKN